MSSYRCHFQCPASGLPVEAVYAFGRLSVDVDEEYLRKDYGPQLTGGDEAEWTETVAHTRAWAEGVKGRYGSVEMAQHALVRAGVDRFDAELEAGW